MAQAEASNAIKECRPYTERRVKHSEKSERLIYYSRPHIDLWKRLWPEFSGSFLTTVEPSHVCSGADSSQLRAQLFLIGRPGEFDTRRIVDMNSRYSAEGATLSRQRALRAEFKCFRVDGICKLLTASFEVAWLDRWRCASQPRRPGLSSADSSTDTTSPRYERQYGCNTTSECCDCRHQ